MRDWTAESEAAFDAYVDALIGVIGHADRAEPLEDYCLGLLMPMERKSVEPLAAVTAPSRVAAKHQSLLHFVGQAPWLSITTESGPWFSRKRDPGCGVLKGTPVSSRSGEAGRGCAA